MLAVRDLQVLLGQRSLAELSIAGAIVGELAHLLYFIRGFRVLETLRIVVFHILSSLALFSLSISTFGLRNGAVTAMAVSSSYLTALFTSMVVYRLFFHPLRKFPGPFMAKVTKLYAIWLWRDGKPEIEMMNMFKKYGDIVRTGPNELVCLSMDGARKAYLQSHRKELFETVRYKGISLLVSMPLQEGHRNRRQVWEKAMGAKTTENHERNARLVTHEWLEVLRQRMGEPINTTLYSTLIPFENMGLMAFSKKFGALATGEEHELIELMNVNLGRLGKLGQLTWPIALFSELGVQGGHTVFENKLVEIAKERRKQGKFYDQDILGAFYEDLDAEKPKAFFNDSIVHADTQTVIIASTDTIASALSFGWSFIAQRPDVQRKLRRELTALFGVTIAGEFTYNDLSETSAPYLNAVINESMRMRAPSGSGLPRTTPAEGIEVDGVFIPGGVIFNAPTHCMHRSDKFFVRPDEWIPERWTDRPDLIIDRHAFMPFVIGAGNCVGRKLAYIVMRFVFAYTLLGHDVAYAPGEDGVAIHRDAMNTLAVSAGKLECCFTPVAA